MPPSMLRLFINLNHESLYKINFTSLFDKIYFEKISDNVRPKKKVCDVLKEINHLATESLNSWTKFFYLFKVINKKKKARQFEIRSPDPNI